MSNLRRDRQPGVGGFAPRPTPNEIASQIYGSAAPTSELIQSGDGQTLLYKSLRLSPVGMIVPPGISKADWEDAGRLLTRMQGSLNWWIGDWLNAFRPEWGNMYELASEITGKTPDTLSNVTSTCARVQLPLRNGNLYYEHHVAVAGFGPEQQKEWLDRAAMEGMSARALRRAIAGKPEPTPDRSPLANRTHYATFKRVFKGVAAGDPSKVSAKDCDQVIEWASAVKAAKIEAEGATSD